MAGVPLWVTKGWETPGFIHYTLVTSNITLYVHCSPLEQIIIQRHDIHCKIDTLRNKRFWIRLKNWRQISKNWLKIKIKIKLLIWIWNESWVRIGLFHINDYLLWLDSKFSWFVFCFFVFSSGSGKLEFEEFCILAARFLIEEDEEQMRKELKEAFRFYDKEGNTLLCKINYYQYYYNKTRQSR